MGNRENMNVLPHKEAGGPGSPNVASNLPLRPDQRKFRAIFAAGFFVLLAILAILPLASPPPLLGLHTCAFKGATGLPCPLCGGTRAVQAVLRGDVARASYLNVAALPAVVALVAVAILLGYEAMRGRAVVHWNALLPGLRPLLPILVAVFFFYWIFHLAGAVRGLKSELVDLRHPVARAICQRFSNAEQ